MRRIPEVGQFLHLDSERFLANTPILQSSQVNRQWEGVGLKEVSRNFNIW